ncbi:MAG TPA: NADH-quinone oxidoreductase subunit A [Bacteroidia bacterium]|jgi:NADH-quinone oxidoreductase subunit A|nr:NADH-quinone oxidoreductase subunit A [Bacteroidia bacterium]
MQGNATDYVPIIFTILVAAGFVATTLVATHALGPKRKTEKKLETFECGIEVQGNARVPYSVKYFLVAILFVLFDVEVIFMYPWAVNFRDPDGKGPLHGLGPIGFVEMVSFMLVFLVGFYYILKKGALKWED